MTTCCVFSTGRCLVLAAAIGALATGACGQISEFYLNTHGDGSGSIYVVRNGVIQRQWSNSRAAGSLVVLGTVRTAGNTGGAGAEFTTAGVPTGVIFGSPGTTGMHVDDSCSDGRFIYGWDYAAQRLVRFNLDWSAPATVFTLTPAAGRTGVAYDETDGSFWLAGWGLSTMDHRTAAGGLISSFPLTGPQNLGLAIDPADQTLWLVRFGTNTLEQWSKTGQRLRTVTVAGLPTVISGGEFAGCARITRPPESVGACAGGTAVFSIAATGVGSGTYRWRRGGVPLVNSPGRISGANTASVTILNLTGEDSGSYDCVVSSTCGNATSDPATLTVCACLSCPADFNQDGGVDGSDVDAFFDRWEAGRCDADVNADGGIDGGDVEVFFAAWEAGGCG